MRWPTGRAKASPEQDKTCSKCRQAKPLDQFYRQRMGKYGVMASCKECDKARRHKYWHTNLEKFNTNATQKRLQKRLALLYILGNKCSHCGIVDIPDIYDIHHTDPESKNETFARLTAGKWARIQAELDKGAILLCANCHRKEHVRLRNMRGK